MDLSTLTEVQQIICRELKNRVLELEQRAHDADLQDFIECAHHNRNAAREVELIESKLSVVLTALFMDELDRMEADFNPSFSVPQPTLPHIVPIVEAELID